MNVTSISKRKFNSLKLLELPNSVFNTEAKMYLFPTKEKWNSKILLLKRLYQTSGEVFSNKLYTINALVEASNDIDIEELIFPLSLAAVDDEIVGHLMPYISNINLQEIFDSNEFTIEEKTKYLKEIGELLEKMRLLRTYSNNTDFYLNDIHENNFILNKDTGKINVVDLDSAKIGHNLTSGSRYLSSFSNLPLIPKYKKLDASVGGFFKVDDNTELYCYIIMVLNLFYGGNINRISISDYFIYLEYLKELGISSELIDKLSYIYTCHANENPYLYLDELVSIYPQTHKNVFERKLKKSGI